MNIEHDPGVLKGEAMENALFSRYKVILYPKVTFDPG